MLELWAVDVPELHHLNDVIVFATRGESKPFTCPPVDGTATVPRT